MGLLATRQDGLAVTASNVAIGAGWGDTPATFTVTAGSTDTGGQIVVTSAGLNQAQSTATVTLTFRRAFDVAPFTVATVKSTSALTDGAMRVGPNTTATMVLTHPVIPVDTNVYTINYLNVGK